MTASALSAETVRISVDDIIPENKIEIAGGNHAETPIRELSSIEQFFVHVANVYSHQQTEKLKAEAAAAGSKTEQVEAPLYPFRSIEDKLNMARFQIDNLINMIDAVTSRKQIVLKAAEAPPEGAAPSAFEGLPPGVRSALPVGDEHTRRTRYGALVAAKRSHLLDASQILSTGAHRIRDAAASWRTHARDLLALSRFWTLSSEQAQAQAVAGAGVGAAGRAGAASAAAASLLSRPLLVSYSLGQVGLALDRGSSSLGRDAQGLALLGSGAGAAAADSAGKESKDGKESKESKESKGVAAMQEGDDDLPASAGLAGGGASSEPDSAWQRLSNKLHRAQTALLYKELYAQMTREAVASEPSAASGAAASSAGAATSRPRGPALSARVTERQICVETPGFEPITISFAKDWQRFTVAELEAADEADEAVTSGTYEFKQGASAESAAMDLSADEPSSLQGQQGQQGQQRSATLSSAARRLELLLLSSVVSRHLASAPAPGTGVASSAASFSGPAPASAPAPSLLVSVTKDNSSTSSGGGAGRPLLAALVEAVNHERLRSQLLASLAATVQRATPAACVSHQLSSRAADDRPAFACTVLQGTSAAAGAGASRERVVAEVSLLGTELRLTVPAQAGAGGAATAAAAAGEASSVQRCADLVTELLKKS